MAINDKCQFENIYNSRTFSQYSPNPSRDLKERFSP